MALLQQWFNFWSHFFEDDVLCRGHPSLLSCWGFFIIIFCFWWTMPKDRLDLEFSEASTSGKVESGEEERFQKEGDYSLLLVLIHSSPMDDALTILFQALLGHLYPWSFLVDPRVMVLVGHQGSMVLSELSFSLSLVAESTKDLSLQPRVSNILLYIWMHSSQLSLGWWGKSYESRGQGGIWDPMVEVHPVAQIYPFSNPCLFFMYHWRNLHFTFSPMIFFFLLENRITVYLIFKLIHFGLNLKIASPYKRVHL